MHLLEKISIYIYIYICKTQPRAWILRVFQIMFLRTPHTFKTDARSHLIERNIISTFQKKHMVSRFRALESVQRTKHLTSYFSKILDVFRKHASCSLWTQIVPEKARLSPKIIPQIPPCLYSMIIFHDYIPWISMIFPWFFHVYPWFSPMSRSFPGASCRNLRTQFMPVMMHFMARRFAGPKCSSACQGAAHHGCLWLVIVSYDPYLVAHPTHKVGYKPSCLSGVGRLNPRT